MRQTIAHNNEQGDTAMNTNDEIYDRYEDESGEEYFCPVNTVADNQIVSVWELDNCVEVSTAGRYSGNLKIVSRR